MTLVRSWIALWDRREPATALAMVRIGIAVVMLYDYFVASRLELVGPLWARTPDGFATGAGWGGWAVRWLGAGPDAAFTLWLISVIALIAIACGALTRIACVAVVLISAQLAHLAPDADRGIDGMLRVVLVILALSRSHAVWSIDAWVWRKLGRPLAAEVPAWPRYLLLAQLIWIYFSGGHNKVGLEWGPGGGFTALANALTDPHFARFEPGWVGTVYPLTRLATVMTLAFEFSAPLMLLFIHYAATADRPGRIRRWCNRLRLRYLWIALGVAFHLGIALTLRLGIFPAGMLALYPVLLLPTELTAIGARIRRRPQTS